MYGIRIKIMAFKWFAGWKYAYDHFIALFVYESFMTVNCGFGFWTANEMNFRWTDIDFGFLQFANSFD